ncbi:MAG: CAP domain-containing protein [Candidatus Sumerlaeia bacterium]|nr:CAP domain-containing protein [Candidatus Sumerlaeia bacterium]
MSARGYLALGLALALAGCEGEAFQLAEAGPRLRTPSLDESYRSERSRESTEEFLRVFEEELHRSRREQPGGLRALTRSPLLDGVAQIHAEDMAAQDYFAHDSPQGNDVADRARSLHPRAVILDLRENLHMIETNIPDPAAERARFAQRSLMESPGHRANIVNTQSVEYGLGYAHAVRDGVFHEYSVQVFGIVLGEFRQEPPASLNLVRATTLVPFIPARGDAEWFLFAPDLPRQQFTHPLFPDRVFLGGRPVRYDSEYQVFDMLPMPAGRMVLAARVPGMPPGYGEVWEFESR